MFSLIITIISIALVAALALATIYYGGDAFSKGGDAAVASQLINEGQQLQGALTLRNVQDPTAAALSAGNIATPDVGLVPAYLSQLPANWTVSGETFVNTEVSDAVCAEINKKADVAYTAGVVAAAALDGKVYGCLHAAADDNTVVYKF